MTNSKVATISYPVKYIGISYGGDTTENFNSKKELISYIKEYLKNEEHIIYECFPISRLTQSVIEEELN